MEITGGCVCGGTRYVLKSRPFALVDCHCIDCRRSAGAPYAVWGSVRREDLRMTKGELRKIAHANRIRSFASCCGTHLFFEDSKDSETIDVRSRRFTARRRLRHRKRSGSKTNCPGLSSTSRCRHSRRSPNLLNVRNNSPLILLLSGLLAFAGPVSCGHAAFAQKASYGTRVKYRPGEKIEFPDFTIEYVGERRKTVPVYPRGFRYYDFNVSKGKAEQIVSWTSGTGDIGPMDFEIGGKRYQLELRHSDKLGKLKHNELVIWQVDP
jgi:hypothetical protein